MWRFAHGDVRPPARIVLRSSPAAADSLERGHRWRIFMPADPRPGMKFVMASRFARGVGLAFVFDPSLAITPMTLYLFYANRNLFAGGGNGYAAGQLYSALTTVSFSWIRPSMPHSG